MKQTNLLLFLSVVAITLVFAAIALVQNHLFSEKFEQAQQEAIVKSFQQDKTLALFRGRLTETETALDSLKNIYHHDSTHWSGENEQLRQILSLEKKTTITYKRAYESTKKVLEKARIPRKVPRTAPTIIDLSPVLDSLRTNP